jgi:hypothetical protein
MGTRCWRVRLFLSSTHGVAEFDIPCRYFVAFFAFSRLGCSPERMPFFMFFLAGMSGKNATLKK